MEPTVEDSYPNCRDCPDRSCLTTILTGKELELIQKNRYVNEAKKRTTILNEGSPVSHIIYLRSGLVKEYTVSPDNHEQIIQVFKSHSFPGMYSLFGDMKNHYSYEALSDVKLCYIEIGAFISLIRSNSEFAFEILKSVSKESLSNFHRFINQNHKKIYGRIADVLLYFSNSIFSGNIFQMPLSRSELAEMAGTSRESAGRVISKFRSDGILQIAGKNIIITDVKKLENISKFGT